MSGVGGRSVLEGAFALLEAVERAREAGLTRLSSECGLPKTTAYRLLEQMVVLGAVERRGTGYRMGPRMFRLGHEWQPHPRLRSAASGPVRQLARATGATVGLAVLRQGQTLVLDWTPGENSGALAAQHDRVTWPWFTAAGKVLVAAARPDLPLGPLPASWQRQAALIRDRGAAFDREGVVDEVCCAAVPLYDACRVPVAALFVATDPAHHLERLADVAQRSGKAISRALRGR
ncbi:helix-turn-helix domain-containing protein [Streptomyces sp. HC44]|uniref:Helix-turn-helix domain-containing protein n=1 Tax=Streptomyces scabichelini TaxID=2711217 RepID=A0A6G4VF41_9ACTN|nr:helix-turn-helix domain-containing protein [Streptomyces scabichelini]NGO12417.1 helix-turn-helix domain-containing protein [Streptomyces scabichelini]